MFDVITTEGFVFSDMDFIQKNSKDVIGEEYNIVFKGPKSKKVVLVFNDKDLCDNVYELVVNYATSNTKIIDLPTICKDYEVTLDNGAKDSLKNHFELYVAMPQYEDWDIIEKYKKDAYEKGKQDANKTIAQPIVNRKNIAIIYPTNGEFTDIYIFNLNEGIHEQAKIKTSDKYFVDKLEEFLVGHKKIDTCVVCVSDEVEISEYVWRAIEQRFYDSNAPVKVIRSIDKLKE